jgi:hypothetical protein
MDLGCTICMEMWGNGVRMFGMMITIYCQGMVRLGVRVAIAVVGLCAAVHGAILPIIVALQNEDKMRQIKAIARQVFGLLLGLA